MIAKIATIEIMNETEGYVSQQGVLCLYIDMETPEQKAAVGALIADSQLMNHGVNVEITALPNEGDTDDSKRKVSV